MSQNKTITVLGKTFNSEEERRAYFREELRQKLPELKKMEGFPIGEDEDIIALSDPPYYTACPNPWLNDFVAEWEAEKQSISNRQEDFEVEAPFASDVSEGKNNPIYNAHSYHTKVPHPAIMRYILHYTQPGDIVFDGFAGTGMTGVAAQLCGKPNPQLKAKIEQEFKQQEMKPPVWGARKAILGDLSPIASFIAYNYNTPVDVLAFEQEAQKILAEVEAECGWMYETRHTNGKMGKINYTVWSEVHLCPTCTTDFLFNKVFMNSKTKRISKNPICPNCNSELKKGKTEVIFESYYDHITEATRKKPKREPFLINYSFQGKKFEKTPDEEDLEILQKVDRAFTELNMTKFLLPEMQMTKVGRVATVGVEYIHDFYLNRPLITINKLWERALNTENQRIKNLTKFFVEQVIWGMSVLNRYSPSHFSQVNRALSGVFYIAAHTSEVSPWYILNGKLSRLIKAFNNNPVASAFSSIFTGDGGKTRVKASSIDYIFTDPPFGENIYYSDLNILIENWHRVMTNPKTEAIVDKVKKKDAFTYQNMVQDVFKHYFQVLKPGKWMTVEFSNTSAAIWNGIQISLQNVGFVIATIASLDKKQGTFQAVNSPTAVKQDLVISCYKPSSEFDQKFQQSQHSEVGVWDFVGEHLQHLPVHLVKDNSTTAIIERSPKILYDRLIAFYVQRSLPVPIDARKFQEGLRERFIERDGMFFTNEQVQEYDRKKAEVPNFVQLSLLVSSEQDGVLWLRDLLKQGPLTYQQLHPKWMTALGGVRKGDVIPELADILEENFLKNEAGAWYLPDPENEADLEKLRTNRLLKEFKSLRQEIGNSKKKIKEVRVEAVRAGFKQCYQDKDFQTIVQVGDRIPGKILMEDEVLLQFYDIASSKV